MKRSPLLAALALLLLVSALAAVPGQGPATAPAQSSAVTSAPGPWWQSPALAQLRLDAMAAQQNLMRVLAATPDDATTVTAAAQEVQRLAGELRTQVAAERSAIQSSGLCLGGAGCGCGCGCGFGAGCGAGRGYGRGYGRGQGMRGACRWATN